jgi:excisionase family DNA binding protein
MTDHDITRLFRDGSLISVDDAAIIMATDRATVLQLVLANDLPHLRCGAEIRIPSGALPMIGKQVAP